MKYYTQSVMKLELTREEMICLKKFANFLDEYEEDINDDADTICDILTVISDMGIGDDVDSTNDKDYLKSVYNIDIKVI